MARAAAQPTPLDRRGLGRHPLVSSWRPDRGPSFAPTARAISTPGRGARTGSTLGLAPAIVPAGRSDSPVLPVRVFPVGSRGSAVRVGPNRRERRRDQILRVRTGLSVASGGCGVGFRQLRTCRRTRPRARPGHPIRRHHAASFNHLFGAQAEQAKSSSRGLFREDPFCALRRTQADGKQHVQLILRRRHDVWRQTHSHPAPFGRA